MTPEQQRRLQELESFTTPNMHGFFPDQSAGRKSKVLTFFDTETDDRSRILTIAAHKVVFNYDKLRFENADEGKGFFRVYNPVNVDKNIARTEGKHGLFGAALAKMRARSGANYSSNWDLSQYEEFKQWVGDSELAGHNIVGADIPWILRPTGRDFNLDTYKKGFFDTLHYAKGIVGNESAALQDLRKKYSSQLKGFNLEAHEASGDVVLNIKVLEQMIRSNLKNPLTAEALYAFGMKGVQTGWKQNLNLEEGQGQIIYGARGKPLHNLPYRNAKQALKGWKTTTGFDNSETYVLDLKEAFNIPQDVYDTAMGTSGYLSSNYTEGPIGSGNMDKDLIEQYNTMFDRYKALDASKVVPHTSVGYDDDAKRAVKAFRQLFSTKGEGWDSNMITIPDPVAASMTAVFRQMGYNPSDKDVHKEGSLYQLYARRALEENAAKWWDKQVQYNTTAGNLLAKDKSKYTDQQWWQELAALDVNDVSPAAIEQYKEAKKDYLRKQKEIKKQQKADAKKAAANQELEIKAFAAGLNGQHDTDYASMREDMARDFKKSNDLEIQATVNALNAEPEFDYKALRADMAKQQEKRERVGQRQAEDFRLWSARNAVDERLRAGDNRRRTQDEYARGNLGAGDLKQLNTLNAATKDYVRTLDKLIDKNQRLTKVTKAIAGSVSWYNPMQLADTIGGQAGEIKKAAHGILPGFMEKPIFRFADAFSNLWQQNTARWKYATDMASMAGGAIGAGVGAFGGPLGLMVGSQVGSAVGRFGGQIVGGYAQKQVTEYGEGIQHRLNLIGMTASLLGAFANGLKMAIGLFGKLGQIWNYMPSYTLHNLTNNAWNRAQPMQAGDRMLGFQAGTTANMFNQLAFQQADLYTSGMYDETKLVAAARLGIFDLAYGEMGGDIQKQQADIYDSLYHQLYESGLSKAEQQSMMSLIKNYSPEMLSMLERGNGMVKAGYNEYRQLSGFTGNYGRNFLSSNENAHVSRNSQHWDLDQRSFREAISLAGAKAYDLGEPVIKALEDSLWNFIRTGDIDFDRVWEELGKLIAKIDFSGLNFDGWGDKFKGLVDLLDPLLEEIKNKFKNWVPEVLGEFTKQMSLTKIQFHPDKLFEFLVGKEVSPSEILSISTPQSMGEELAQSARQTYKRAAEQAKQVASEYGWNTARALTDDEILTNAWDTIPNKGMTREQWNDVAYTLAESTEDGTQHSIKLKAVRDVVEGVPKILSKNDIAQWNGQDAVSILGGEAFKGLQGILSPEEISGIAGTLIRSQLVQQGYKQVIQTGADSVEAVFRNGKNAIRILIDDQTQNGINAKTEAVQTAGGS